MERIESLLLTNGLMSIACRLSLIGVSCSSLIKDKKLNDKLM